MKFSDLDAKMRAFERANDAVLPASGFLIARLDGRGFTKLTKQLLTLEKPFDLRFHDAMSQTVAYLFDCGFTVRFAYSQSDEISLFFEPDGVPFERKTRKILSILAGEASAQFSLAIGSHGAFDCRLVTLETPDLVHDYFLWRAMDATRNALSAHCYWLLRASGAAPRAATQRFEGASGQEKRKFLMENGIVFESLPRWQMRGFAVRWESFEKPATNPKTGENVLAKRKQLVVDRDLSAGDSFDDYLNGKLGLST